MIKSFCYFLLTGLILLTLNCLNTQAQSTPLEIKTDTIARKAIQYLNANVPDSTYTLMGDKFKQQISLTAWNNIYKLQLSGLLPFTDVTFVNSANAVNKYIVQGKVKLVFYASLDSADKLQAFIFTPYHEAAKPVIMTETERRTDTLARKILTLMDHRQADSIYLFAADGFKKNIDVKTWQILAERSLYPLLPLPPAVFVKSIQGVNKYRMGSFEFLFNRDDKGKFEILLIEPYREEVVKKEKVLSDNPLKTRLDSAVNRVLSAYIRTKGNIGLSAGIYYKGKDHFYNYGETTLGYHHLPDSHTLYEIGSITKTFTATLLAIAVNEGKVKLNTPITRLLPDSVAADSALKEITLKQLANHTSGLPRMPNDMFATTTDKNQPYEHYDVKHLFAYLKNFTPTRKSGVTYEYSNLGAGLLGVILERIYHKTYEELVKQYITVPAGLTQTKIKLNPNDVKLLAQGYNEDGDPAPTWRMASLKAAGAIKSSAYDMLKYGKLQLLKDTNRLSKALKLTHKITFDDNYNKIGLMWIYFPQDTSILEHGGATGGYRSMICLKDDKKIVVTTLTNNATTGDALGLQLIAVLNELH